MELERHHTAGSFQDNAGTIQSALFVNKRKLVQIALHYGKRAQNEKLIEEMAELMVEIKHMYKHETSLDFDTNNNTPATDNYLEEFADVLIMAEQIKILLSSKESSRVAWYVNKKVLRTLEKISQGKSAL